MRLRFLGTLAISTGLMASAGCANPWSGFEWMFPKASGEPAASDEEELMSKMRTTDNEVWATGMSDRSRDIESRLGVR
ncbi:MAG TPA: hypothetical protein VGN57_09480 [Pirellulaceae bacterium]|nr:hypothetical protein [Pirellulaceae bacterium]